MNRWSAGEANPWSGADWTASWRRTTVTESEWAALRERLRGARGAGSNALGAPHDVGAGMNGVIASVAHLAYHLGAIRQIDQSTQGPKATAPTRRTGEGDGPCGGTPTAATPLGQPAEDRMRRPRERVAAP